MEWELRCARCASWMTSERDSFFFSSRRRHTRFDCDWSSDVCSSDLAIYVVLGDGRIVDTIVHGLFTPLANLAVALAAVGMMVVHMVIHVPVPSVSGQADRKSVV